MAITGQRGSAPIVLRIKLRYHDADLFIRQLFRYVNSTGMFLRSPRPKPVGNRLIVAFKLANGESVFECEGYIRWVNPPDGSMGPSGMGVEFVRVSPGTRRILGRILKVRAQKGLADVREIPFSPDGFTLPRRRAPSIPPMSRADVADEPAAAAAPAAATPSASARVGASAASGSRPVDATTRGRAHAAIAMQALLTRAETEGPAPKNGVDSALLSLLDGAPFDLARALARARALVEEPSSEEAFDERLVDALSSVPDGTESDATADSSREVSADRAPSDGGSSKASAAGKYESPKEVVARLKRAAAAAKAAAEAEKAAKAEAKKAAQAKAEISSEEPSGQALGQKAGQASERAFGPATAESAPAAEKPKFESPKEVVARLKRAAAKAAQEAATEAAREEKERAEAAERAAAEAQAADEPAEPSAPALSVPPPRRESPKEVVARLKRAAAEAAAKEAVRAAADAAVAATGKQESPKEVVARLKRAAAEAAAKEPVPEEPKPKKESPKEVVARLKRAAAAAAFKPPSAEQYDIARIPRVDGIPAGLVEVSEPEIRIVPEDDGPGAPAPLPEVAVEVESEPAAAAPAVAEDDDLLPAGKQAIPLSELEPLAPVARHSDPRELADDDFPDIETIDQPTIDPGFLDVGSMADDLALPGASAGDGSADDDSDLMFAAGADDFDFDSMFDAAVGPAALSPGLDDGLDAGIPTPSGEFGLDLLSDDEVVPPPPAPVPAEPALDVKGDGDLDILSEAPEDDPFSMDALAHHPTAIGHSNEQGMPILEAVSSELLAGPLDAVPAVLISEDSRGIDVDNEIHSALESLSGNIKIPREIDFEFDAAFESAVAPDPVSEDVGRERAGTSSIEISFTEDDDELDELFDSSGPSGLELALRSDEPLARRSSQVIAPPESGPAESDAQDPTMILDDLDGLDAVEATGAASEFDSARARNSMSVEFDAGALDADGLMATDLSGLARQQSRQAEPALGAEPTLEHGIDRAPRSRKPPLPAPPMPEAVEEELDDMLEELSFDDDELLLVDDDEQPSGPPAPPSRPSTPPPPAPPGPPGPPAPFNADDGITADDLAASQFGFGDDMPTGDEDLEKADIKKRGFFGRLFKK